MAADKQYKAEKIIIVKRPASRLSPLLLVLLAVAVVATLADHKDEPPAQPRRPPLPCRVLSIEEVPPSFGRFKVAVCADKPDLTRAEARQLVDFYRDKTGPGGLLVIYRTQAEVELGQGWAVWPCDSYGRIKFNDYIGPWSSELQNKKNKLQPQPRPHHRPAVELKPGGVYRLCDSPPGQVLPLYSPEAGADGGLVDGVLTGGGRFKIIGAAAGGWRVRAWDRELADLGPGLLLRTDLSRVTLAAATAATAQNEGR